MTGFSHLCLEYLDSAIPADTMSTGEIRAALASAGVDGGASFTALLELKDAIGRRKIRDRSWDRPSPPAVGSRSSRLRMSWRPGGPGRQVEGRHQSRIFQTIGVPRHFRFTDRPLEFVEFFDIGVAAPCQVGLTPDGSVAAFVDGDEGPREIAETFEVFLEGRARSIAADLTYERCVRATVDGPSEEILARLPSDSRVEEASDRWTTWWDDGSSMATLSTMWSAARSRYLWFWTNHEVPEAFRTFSES